MPGLDPRPRAPHLEGTLTEYIRHYNEHRPHRGLGLEAPMPGHTTVASPLANIARRSVLGGEPVVMTRTVHRPLELAEPLCVRLN